LEWEIKNGKRIAEALVKGGESQRPSDSGDEEQKQFK
jgi:hypothetical protein